LLFFEINSLIQLIAIALFPFSMAKLSELANNRIILLIYINNV
jgi:hypothetical protein